MKSSETLSTPSSKLFTDFDVKTGGISSSTDSSTCHDVPTVAAAKPALAPAETAAAYMTTNPTPQELEHFRSSGSSTEIIESWTWGNAPGETSTK